MFYVFCLIGSSTGFRSEVWRKTFRFSYLIDCILQAVGLLQRLLFAESTTWNLHIEDFALSNPVGICCLESMAWELWLKIGIKLWNNTFGLYPCNPLLTGRGHKNTVGWTFTLLCFVISYFIILQTSSDSSSRKCGFSFSFLHASLKHISPATSWRWSQA